jgi:TetR/AcrR family transcriptional repressor of nem operon
MAKPSLRQPLIDAGVRVMFRDGYVGAGVRDIAAAAGAPQGSFTNHFRSKETFACEVLDHYFDHVKDLVSQSLDNQAISPRERLRNYFDLITEHLAEDGFTRGCLIGDFSLEAAPQSELLRARLASIFAEWRQPFAKCIAAGQALGEINSAVDPHELADFMLASWEGAILRMKVDRSPAALERFKTVFFQTIL